MKNNISLGIKQYFKRKEALINGFIPGIKTNFSNLNTALIDGIPKNTINVVAGHSGKI